MLVFQMVSHPDIFKGPITTRTHVRASLRCMLQVLVVFCATIDLFLALFTFPRFDLGQLELKKTKKVLVEGNAGVAKCTVFWACQIFVLQFTYLTLKHSICGLPASEMLLLSIVEFVLCHI